MRKVLKKAENKEMTLEEAKEEVVKKMLSTVQNKLNIKFDEMVIFRNYEMLIYLFLDCCDTFCCVGG